MIDENISNIEPISCKFEACPCLTTSEELSFSVLVLMISSEWTANNKINMRENLRNRVEAMKQKELCKITSKTKLSHTNLDFPWIDAVQGEYGAWQA